MTPSVAQFLRLLGSPHVADRQKRPFQTTKNKTQIPRFRSRRTIALLAYLAVERRPIARAFLAALFWPDETLSNGRANLRRELHNLAQILPDCWELDRQSVAFVPSTNIAVDLYQVLDLEAQACWAEAAELLGGELLEGLHLDSNPEFENWLLGEQEKWRGRAETILRQLIEGHTQRGRYTDALHQTRRLLQLSPWDEQAHRQMMRFLVWTGQRGAALRQFEHCKRALSNELGVEPALETSALYRQIQDGKLDLPPQLPAFLTDEKARHGYERPFFVGRENELARLNTFLDGALAGQSQTVFITGSPGRGKTALLEAFTQQAMEKHPSLLVVGSKCNAYA
ncbi:MAG: AAA family ATPase, partial [Chloroflexi bacterium]|nr:AAA family ATPase [Chloroflexota bacterium]